LKYLFILILVAVFSTVLKAQNPSGASRHFWTDLTEDEKVASKMMKHFNTQIASALAASTRSVQNKATGVAERLIGMGDYDYNTTSPADSFRITYSNGHGSSFNFDNLAYEFNNPTDYPVNGPVTWTGVKFDSLFEYVQTPNVLISARTYNASGNPLQFLYNQQTLGKSNSSYTYSSNGLLANYTVMDWDTSGTGQWVNSYRDFLTYDSHGYLVRDSLEQWAAGIWSVSSVTVYASNASGFPTSIKLYYPGWVSPASSFDIVYNSSNKPIIISRSLANTTNGPLVNYTKDSFTYVANMMTVDDTYRLNGTTQLLKLAQTIIRRLNGAGLPDSIVKTYYPNTGIASITSRYLEYDSYGNPTVEDYFDNMGSIVAERHFYYELYNTVGVQSIAPNKFDIVVYPNPVSTVLYVKGLLNGSYSIYNCTGQLLQKGMLLYGKIPVSSDLSPASYILDLTDENGIHHSANFQKL